MFRDEKLEMKVGIFIGVGIFLMFLIVFSVKDFTMVGKSYQLNVIFDYVNGLTEKAPVRFAGVGAGQIKDIIIFYDKEAERTRVRVEAKIRKYIKIDDDATARINTLGLLGEQYLEISPGTTKNYLKHKDTLVGRNPFNVGQQMEKMNDLFCSLSDVVSSVSKGEGSLGKFIMEDTIYNDVEVIIGRLRKGEGTIGKLLVSEEIYDNANALVADLKENPWKLLSKSSSKKK